MKKQRGEEENKKRKGKRKKQQESTGLRHQLNRLQCTRLCHWPWAKDCKWTESGPRSTYSPSIQHDLRDVREGNDEKKSSREDGANGREHDAWCRIDVRHGYKHETAISDECHAARSSLVCAAMDF